MTRFLTCVVLLAGLAPAAWAGDEAPRPIQIQIMGDPAAAGAFGVVAQAVAGDAPHVKLGDYWLGILCRAPSEDERKELKLPENGGLWVEQIVPQSPADAAKVKEGDVLLKAGDKELKQVEDLLEAVNAAKDKELKLELLRAEKKITVAVVPAKRPATATILGMNDPNVARAFEYMFKQPGGEKPDENTMQFHMFGPGLIMKGGADVLVRRTLPDDMTITITRTGKKPAEITVKQGEKTYEATEEKLDKLPKEIRPHVEGMLGRVTSPLGDHIRVFDAPLGGAGGGVPAPRIERFRLQHDPNLEKRLDEMSKQLDQLKGAVEELRELKGDKAPAKKAPKQPAVEKDAREL